MGQQGKLNIGNIGHTMPVDAPAYHKGPFHFRGARMYRFEFETDADAAAALIPEQLRLTDTATATLTMAEYPWSTIGYYQEAILGLNVHYGDDPEPLSYMTHLLLDSDTPILVGRDISGIPKKSGIINFTEEGDITGAYAERPEGIRICSSVFRTETPLPSPPDGTLLRTCDLRVIPSPEEGKDHSLVELLQTDFELSNIKMWAGSGSCDFPESSIFDPWYKLPVKKMLQTNFMETDIIMPPAKILETL